MAGSRRPIALWVELNVRPEYRGEFLDALLEDARGSRANEPGCLRFEVLLDEADPNRFLLLEVYRDDAAIEAHRVAPHFQRISAGLGGWLARPAVTTRTTYVDPPDPSAG